MEVEKQVYLIEVKFIFNLNDFTLESYKHHLQEFF